MTNPGFFSALSSDCLCNLFVKKVSVHAAAPGFTLCNQGVHLSHWPYLSGPYLYVLITLKLGGRRMHRVLFLTSGVSASYAYILMANKPK